MLNTPSTIFEDSFSEEVWRTTYKDHKDKTIDDTLRRVAKAISSVETTDTLKHEWENIFYNMLSNFKVVPGGRIMSNAGTEWKGTTLANCFVAPRAQFDIDSLDGILKNLQGQAFTLKSEGGWGENFSYIRPRGSFIAGVGVETPGAVKYMELFDKSSEIITAGSGRTSVNKKAKGKIRKGAMMSVLDVWHPDIVEFITAKQQAGRLTKFNISVNCTDDFMYRIGRINQIETILLQTDELTESNKQLISDLQQEKDQLNQWELVFPDTTHINYKTDWDGNIQRWKSLGHPIIVHAVISATWLWNLIMDSTYQRAEPGVLFLDRANNFNPLSYGEHIMATNPSMPAGTLVHTKNKIVPIEQLEGLKFEVKSLDGVWAEAECRMSGENEELLEITFGVNKSVKSTKQHRWPVYDERMNRLYKVDASDLKPGDLIPLNRNENIGIYGDMSLTHDEGFLMGYMVGDGWFDKKYKDDPTNNEYDVGITFGIHEREMAERVLSIVNSLKSNPSTICEREGELYIQWADQEFVNNLLTKYGMIPGEKDIPSSVWCSNDLYIQGFVDGLLSADGCVLFDDKNQRITLTTSGSNLAKNFGKLLGFAGVPVSLQSRTLSNSQVSFPNGKTHDREYERWDVAINGSAIINFFNVFNISHPSKSSKLEDVVNFVSNKTRSHISNSYLEVSSVVPCGTSKVWDISVYHNQHVFPTEWCYTGNCGEQVLAPGNICCLSSLNLTQFINKDHTGFDFDQIEKHAEYMVRFLDNVNEYSSAPLPEYIDSMRNKRRIGCGLMGWGSALYMLKIPFASERALKLQNDLMQIFSKATYTASVNLAKEKGMFKYCVPELHVKSPFIQSLGLPVSVIDDMTKTGIRNSSLMSIQPTGNSSIMSNIVSGGIEPVFMAEYVRTVIVNTMPEEIRDVCPKWYEGEWYETDMFKFTKEGDEEMLKGTHNGITYKIDKNRGLVKEVLCEDYGVRWLKRRGEWDATADWASTTTQLSADQHVTDLVGFARYIDSAISKTVNLPNEYSFDQFKELYLNAYNTGFIKGLTTYRSGTMSTVLSAKEESTEHVSEEEIIIEDVKVPNQAPATISTIKADGKKWYLTTILDNSGTRPIAFFVHTNHYEKSVTTHDAVERLINLAYDKGIPTKWIEDTQKKIEVDNNPTKIARAISLNLRHGVLIKNVVAVLDKVDDVFVGSFLFQIRKFLSTYIKDGEKIEGETCGECGGQLIFQEGCRRCLSCSNSKCG
jgi:ribonucleoside-diphosphate reductase alpha chain